MQRYERYKDSGIAWLGEIPEHWEVKRLKAITRFVNRGSTPSYVDKSKFYIVNQATFSKGFFDMTNIKYTNETFTGYLSNRGKILNGDLLIASTGGGVLGKVALFDKLEDKFIADSHVTIVRADNNNNTKYFYYFFTINYILINGVLAQGSTNQTELQRSWLLDFKLPVPPLHEQKAIAAFLDEKCEKIDAIISIKERQIEKLKELRQITIHNAVTKGINSNTEMKNSGIDWIGEIPKHWEVKRLKFVFQILKRIAGEVGHNVLAITQKGIKIKDITSGEGQLAMDYSKYQYAYKGDFAMNHMDLLTGWVDISNFDGVISPDYRVFQLTSTANYPPYFLHLLQNCYRNKAFYAHGQGVSMLGRWRFPAENFNNFYFPIPPISEQEEIVAYLDDRTAKIDHAISQKQEQITKLKEYKQSLINEVVTGKVRITDKQLMVTDKQN